MEPDDNLEEERILIRNLNPGDLDAVIQLDKNITRRGREEYFKLKLKQALSDTGVMISLGAELEGVFAGFVFARVYYGEFGMMEPTAVLDTMGVHPDFRRRGVGAALIDQLRTNLLGLGIRWLQTQVSWESLDVISFFNREGFEPAPRYCLDLDLKKTRRA